MEGLRDDLEDDILRTEKAIQEVESKIKALERQEVHESVTAISIGLSIRSAKKRLLDLESQLSDFESQLKQYSA